MDTFVFRAIDLAGVPSRGEVEAESKQAVTDQLKSRGLIVLDIDSKGNSKEINLNFLERIKLRDLAVLTRQLATMINAGVTILRALYVLEGQTETKKLRETLIAVREDVGAGLALSDAMARHPKVFSPLYIAMIRSGETGGVLEESLQRISDQLEKEDALRRQVRAAMVYPAVVVTFAGAVMLALVAFIVPVFAKVFKDFGGKLPALTRVTVGASNVVTHQFDIILIVAG